MKDGRCPKCGGSRIARTEFVVYMGAGLSGPTMELYACSTCKYCEHFLKGSVEEKVKILDSWKWVQREEGGPFRQ